MWNDRPMQLILIGVGGAFVGACLVNMAVRRDWTWGLVAIVWAVVTDLRRRDLGRMPKE